MSKFQRILLGVALGLGLLALGPISCIGSAQSKADRIIARYYRAVGGYGTLKSIRTLHMVGTHQERGMTIHFDFAWQRPNVRRVNWRFDGSLYGAEGFDGERPWEIAAGESQARTLDGVKADAARRGAEFDESFVDYASKGHHVAWIGRERFEDRPVDRVRVTLADGWIKDYYFDARTGLIAALSKSMPVHGEGEAVTSLTRYLDYREVAGVLMPHGAEERDLRSGDLMSANRWASIEANVEIADELLRAPEPANGAKF